MAKRKIVWSPKAKSELLEILIYFHKRNGTKSYSNKLSTRIRRSVRLLCNQPNLGLMTDVDKLPVYGKISPGAIYPNILLLILEFHMTCTQ